MSRIEDWYFYQNGDNPDKGAASGCKSRIDAYFNTETTLVSGWIRVMGRPFFLAWLIVMPVPLRMERLLSYTASRQSAGHELII